MFYSVEFFARLLPLLKQADDAVVGAENARFPYFPCPVVRRCNGKELLDGTFLEMISSIIRLFGTFANAFQSRENGK